MAVIVATRTKMHRARFLPKFLVANMRVAWQARRTPGFLGGRLRVEQGGAFWTLTAWESGRDMVGFRDSGAHETVMPRLAEWASEGAFGVWNTAESTVPHWDEASGHVATRATFVPLHHPSAAHESRIAARSRRFGVDIPIPAPSRAAVRPNRLSRSRISG